MELKRACNIEQIGKSRNGGPRYWCRTHGAGATGRYGVRLSECESAYRDVSPDECFDLDETQFEGGIALWGAVAPIYDTTNLPGERGIHVHARRQSGGDKDIDQTFRAVSLQHRRDLLDQRRIIIGEEAAINYYVSRFLGREVSALFCNYCGELHLDAGYFAVHPHRRHLCHGCGKFFQVEHRGVSNPIQHLRSLRPDIIAKQRIERATRTLEINQSDAPGGIQIWASNPAIFWSSDRAEEEGIHVHAFDGVHAKPFQDNTFGSVKIDGFALDETMVGYLMAQQALPHLKNKIVSLSCPACDLPHFDRGDDAFYPHKERVCKNCKCVFLPKGGRKLVVSNPLVATIELLKRAHESRQGERQQ